MITETSTSHYLLEDTWLSFTTNNEEIHKIIDYGFSAYRYQQNPTGTIDLQVNCWVQNNIPPLPPEIIKDANLIHQGVLASYYEKEDLWLLDYGNFGWAIINKLHAKSQIMLKTIVLKQLSYKDYLLPVFELLRAQGLYLYHSAAVAIDNQGILIAGKSGQGKTTLALQLFSQGGYFLADDRCLLKSINHQIKIINFRESVRAFPENLSSMSQFQGLKANTPEGKAIFSIEDFLPRQYIGELALKLLCFPNWTPGVESSLALISPAQALKQLLPLTMECFDPDQARAQFDFNCQLVETIPAYQINLGDNRDLWYSSLLKILTSL